MSSIWRTMSKFYSTNSFCIFSMLFPKHYTKFVILNGSKISSKGSTSYAQTSHSARLQPSLCHSSSILSRTRMGSAPMPPCPTSCQLSLHAHNADVVGICRSDQAGSNSVLCCLFPEEQRQHQPHCLPVNCPTHCHA